MGFPPHAPNRLGDNREMSGLPADNNSSPIASTGLQNAPAETFTKNIPGILTFTLDPESWHLVRVTGDTQALLGLNEKAVAAHGALLRAGLHRDDRFTVEAVLEEALTYRKPFVATYRWVRPDSGHVRFLHCRASFSLDGALFNGCLIDITESLSLLQGQGVEAVTLGANLTLMGLHGITLDLDLSIRTTTTSLPPAALCFGRNDYSSKPLSPGGSLLDHFSSVDSRHFVSHCFEVVLGDPDTLHTYEWAGYRATICVINPRGIPEGFLLFVIENHEQERLREENAALRLRIEQLENSTNQAQAILNASQEALGYAAVIERQKANAPLLSHMTNALTSCVKELGTRAQALAESLNNPTAPRTTAPKALIRSRKATSSPVALFAAPSNTTGHTYAALLSDSGISTHSCTNDGDSIRATLTQHSSVRILILDVTERASPTSNLIRSILRLYPSLHTVTLVPGPTSQFPDLQRAGALLVLPKPLTTRELERVVRGLLHLSQALDATSSDVLADDLYLPSASAKHS